MANQRTILLVDDDTTLSDMYAERLRGAGYGVTIAHDGEKGLAEATAKTPDLILLDIMMPKMNGIETLKALKADPRTAAVPVVLLTALIQELDKVKGMNSGAQEYLVKSEVMPGELIERIERIFQKIGRPQLTVVQGGAAGQAPAQPAAPQQQAPRKAA
jgi:DNA-binding response OmpR family regulator